MGPLCLGLAAAPAPLLFGSPPSTTSRAKPHKEHASLTDAVPLALPPLARVRRATYRRVVAGAAARDGCRVSATERQPVSIQGAHA